MTGTETAQLRDGTEVIIRPMTTGDLESSLAFFVGLPEEDRACLRRDVTKMGVIQLRIREMQDGSVRRLVALVHDEIVADGAIELASYGWERHVGELRLIVAREYQRKGLGTVMAHSLYVLASSMGIEELVVKMMLSQSGARNIFRNLGFRDETVLHNFVKDTAGKRQDLILMRCDLGDLWRRYEEFVCESDLHAFRMY